MIPRPPAVLAAAVVAAAVVAAAGCGGRSRGAGSQPAPVRCDDDDACPQGQVCNKAVHTCGPPREAGAGGGEGGPGDGEGQGGAGPAEGEGEGEGDDGQPYVVQTAPAHGTRGVVAGPDFRVTVQFSEPVTERKVVAGIYLQDDQGRDVGLQVVYDAATRTATAAPDAPLRPYGVYKVTVRSEIDDLDDPPQPLREEVVRFSVAGPAALEEAHHALAAQYAPVVFQDTGPPSNTRVRRDYLLAYDFDGTWDGDGKIAAVGAAGSRLEGAVYYSVIESVTHHFIHYVYYHSQDVDPLSGEVARENSMRGAVVVVAKPGGGVRLVETYSPDNRRMEPFGAPGTAFRAKDGIGEREVVAMGEEWLEGGKRHRAFITELRHDSCMWDQERNDALSGPFCRHEARRFKENSGIQYRVSAAGEAPDWREDADCADECFRDGRMCRSGGCRTTAYRLRSLAAELWVRRAEFGAERIWVGDSRFRYDAPAGREGLGTAFQLPGRLRGDEGDDPNSGAPPWSWEDRDAPAVPRGTWFLDPAWAIAQRIDLAGETWSDKYCWNPYLGIDNRGTEGCP